MTLEQRLCLSFLQCDTELIRDKYGDGSTASVVIVQSKGAFWEAKDDLDLILAHVGDTRVLLCEAPRGESIQLTTDHHPDAVMEVERIRKMAAYVSADSFGENMFLGQLANTRALGDIAMKPFGVSAEPELIRRTVKANEAAFLVLISDGISSVMSNQEVVDCVKLESNPTQAAANVLNLAEQLGAEDNCTVMVVKLPAWGTKMPDLSKELREYRWQSEAQQSRARRR
ncbi:phosphatase 2C-like domain-containing protein [Lobosporangium transversale]|uniref:Phosphatase 2C-like domain-containing protein n=1 Tax=Lobosporangium transversale TaxID=64571 RepID=A0A1Y2GAR1_9FUNG|nr:phosphatase 2C-like domain-containing protein [Lobosporangium transversale]ORZ05730.1 phosphatase 2C-like domain-containing protein [Lobosporangium transversale]|eukprot:XP_021877217.1 phosphatase 2C-like domain-containing protein [Lobosporangium transversale]